MRLHLALLAAAAATVDATSAVALDPSRKVADYLIDFWQEDAGLPQKFVYVIRQTSDGYLWIGTRGGLARFDGVRFTVFDDLQPGQLEESEVVSLAEAADGSLWIGTNGGGVTRHQRGRFTTLTTRDGLPSDFVPSLAAAPDGRVWIGTQKGLVCRRPDGSLENLTEGLPHPQVEALYFDERGVLWIGTQRGLASLAGQRLVNFAAQQPEVLGYRTLSITGDGRGGLWVGMLETNTPLVLLKDGRATAFDSAQVGGSITGLSVDGQGTLWISSPSGLSRYRDGRFEKLQADVSGVGATHVVQTSSLRRTQAVFADREGSVWVGTPTDGLARLRDAVFTTVSPREHQGVEERISALFEDHQSGMWMAMDAGGVARQSAEGWQLLDVGTKRSLDTVFEHPAGTIWTGNEEKLFRLEAGAFRAVEGPTNLGSAAVVDGTLWVGSKGDGLLQYVDGRFVPYDSGGQIGQLIRGLAADRRGGLWIAAKDTGVACLRGGKVTRYAADGGGRGFSAAAIYVDPKDVAWAATRRGLVRIDGDKVTTFTAEHGLVANYFYQIVEDDIGYLWLTYGRGIARVSRQALEDVAAGKVSRVDCQTFGTESGIKATTMVVPNQPAALKRRDGHLWFATGRGAAVVDPQALVRNHVPPPVWVEQLRVDKQARRAEEGAVFPPGDGDVEIAYAGLSFIAPRRVFFRFRLEGFDPDWIDAGTRRVAYYTNLPPGRYRFRVQACNNDGVWNETGHTLTFELQPHWHQTGWFRVSAILLLGFAVVGAHRWRVRAHREREQELARRVDEAVGHVKMLRGMLPICAGCKKIRDDRGYWNQMETYIQAHSEADFSHGMCPDCIARLYPDYDQAQRTTHDPRH